MIGIVAALVWADNQGEQDRVRGILTLGLIPIVIRLERWLELDPTQHVHADRQTLHDLGHMLANAAVGVAAGAAMLVVPWMLAEPLASYLGASPWPGEWPWAVQCVIAVAAADFLGYWVHRLEHSVPSLWAYHVVHHDLTRLHILRGTREHFVTTIVRSTLIFFPLLVLGAPVETLFFYQTLAVTQGSIAHGNLRLSLPNWIHRWILTPQTHRIHHALDRALSDSNYSSVTPLWDRMFGTFTDPTEVPPPAIGAEGGDVPGTYLGQLAHPFRTWFRRNRSA